MRGIRGDSWARICYVASATTIALFWLTYAIERRLYADWGTLVRSSSKPPIVDGRVLNLQHFVNPALERRNGGYLVLVTSDQCRYSQDEMSAWEALFGKLTVRSGITVVMVSTHGDAIPTRLRTALDLRGIPNQTLQVSNRAAFVEETGLGWTPHTVALDSKMRVRLTSERVTPTVAEQLTAWTFEQSQRERR
jgi:hypothetical protein